LLDIQPKEKSALAVEQLMILGKTKETKEKNEEKPEIKQKGIRFVSFNAESQKYSLHQWQAGSRVEKVELIKESIVKNLGAGILTLPAGILTEGVLVIAKNAEEIAALSSILGPVEDYSYNNLQSGDATNSEVTEMDEIYKRAISMGIGSGQDIVSNPSQFNLSFADDDLLTKGLYSGPVSAVRVGIIQDSPGIKVVEQILPTLQSVQNLTQLQAIESSLIDTVALLKNWDDNEERIAEIARVLGKTSPQLAIYFKNLAAGVLQPKSLSQEQLQNLSTVQYLLNPTYEQINHSALDLVVSGASGHVVMLEAEALIVEEEYVAQALLKSTPLIEEYNQFQKEFAQKCQQLANTTTTSTSSSKE
jgi:hypothetical protein